MFQDYYKEHTDEKLKMSYKTYFIYFKTFKYGFSVPKTDVCDFCSECSQKLKVDSKDPSQIQYMLHQKKVERYMKLKKEIIERSKNDHTCLAIEFDYGQNLPLPKLNVTSQFYRRLLWCYIFNP